MKRGFICLSLTLLIKTVLSKQHSLNDNLKLIGTIQKPENFIQSILTPFAEDILILVSQTKIFVYNFNQSFDLILTKKFRESAEKQLLNTGVDKGGEIFLFFQKLGLVLDDENHYNLKGVIKLIGDKSKVSSFSNLAAFNHYDLKLAICDGNEEKVWEWDYRYEVPRILEVEAADAETSKVIFLYYINYGLELGVLYQDGVLIVYDDTTYQELYHIDIKEINPSFKPKKFFYSDYSELFIIQNEEKEIIFFKEKKYLKEIDFEDNISRIECPRGTRVLIVITKSRLFFITLDDQQIVYIKRVPSGEWYKQIDGSSYFITKTKEAGKVDRFDFYHLKLDNPVFCHETCNKKCKESFKPCVNMSFFYFVFGCCFTGCFCFITLLFCFEHAFKWSGDQEEVVEPVNQNNEYHSLARKFANN